MERRTLIDPCEKRQKDQPWLWCEGVLQRSHHCIAQAYPNHRMGPFCLQVKHGDHRVLSFWSRKGKG